jgi:hypothetical protein
VFTLSLFALGVLYGVFGAHLAEGAPSIGAAIAWAVVAGAVSGLGIFVVGFVLWGIAAGYAAFAERVADWLDGK